MTATTTLPTAAPAAATTRAAAGRVLDSVRAELLRLRRWPALWVLAGLWTVLQVMFSFAFPYIAYRSGDPDAFGGGGPQTGLLDSMLPAAVPVTVVQGTPMFGGAIALILGALTLGSGYAWGTWKTAFTQAPRRLEAVAGTLIALLATLVLLLALTVGIDLGLSTLIAAAESQPIVMPDWLELARAAGSALLVLTMWCSGGALLGTLTRSAALSVGLGLVWTLVVENLLRGAANLVDGLALVTDRLPGTAAGSLAGALGAAADGPDATPGVLTTMSGPAATAALALYVLAFTLGTAWLVRRRDVA